MIAAMRDRLADERGFTLVELLTTMLIGIVVFSAAMGLTEVAGRASQGTTDRVEVAQRARLGMERLVRQLRSQVCLDSTTFPVITGDDNSVTFYVDYDNNPVYKPQKRTLTYDPTGAGKITEYQYDATTTSAPWSFAASPSRTFTLVTNVGNVGTTPVFRYFNPSGSQLATPLSTVTTSPLPANSIGRVSLIEVSFETLPTSGNQDPRLRADRDTRVFVRNSDTQGPVCS